MRLQNGGFLFVMQAKWVLWYILLTISVNVHILKKSDQFQCYKYVQLKRNHLAFSKSIIFVEKCNLSEIVPGVQNLLYGAISEILLGKRPGLEREQNLAVWRTGIANGKLFLMLVTVPFLCRSPLKEGYCDISPRLKYFCGHL